MPRLDDPELKLKQKKPFARKSLRPWDDPEEFIPTKTENFVGKKIIAENNKETLSYSDNSPVFDDENQLVNNRETIGDQLVNNKETIGNQLVNNRETIGNQLVNNKVNNRETIGKQIHLKTTNSDHDFETTVYGKIFSMIRGLYGLQKTTLFYIVENCKERGLLYTTGITNEFLRSLLNTDSCSVKTTIQRLIQKNLICRKEAKKGKGGYTIFSITPIIRNAAIETIKLLDINDEKPWLLVENRKTIGKQLVNNKVNNKVNNDTVGSSSYINTTTNLGIDIPESWQGLSLEPLEHAGFQLSHLIQIHREYEKNPESLKLSPEMIQGSIDAMAFDLKHNKAKLNFQKSPVIVLVSMLKRAQPYCSVTPAEYLSPREEAMQQYQKSEAARKERELKQMQELKDLELQYWQENLSAEELLTFCPETELQLGLPEKVKQAMRRKKALELSAYYFSDEVWPKKKQEILEALAKQTPQGG